MTTSTPVYPGDIRDVTVVLYVQDHARTLRACLDSLLGQTIGAERVEVIAVDDGSTDSSASLLAEAERHYADWLRAGQFRRGLSPAEARNWGMSQATGRYVLFLTGADRLTPKALELMVGSADANEADVVLGKLESSGKHTVATSMFRKTQGSVDLYASRVYWSLTPDKLFRTSLVRRCGLEFPTDMAIGDDQAFTAAALVRADDIAVVADEPCVVKGPSGNGQVPLSQRITMVSRMIALLTAMLPPGPRQDLLISRHLEADLGKATGPLLLASDQPAERERTLWAAAELLRGQVPASAFALLPRPLAVRFALIAAGFHQEAQQMAAYEADKTRPAPKKTVENGRVYSLLPYFRDPAVNLPDTLFDITGQMTVNQQLTGMKWNGPLLLLDGHAFFEQLSTRERNTKVVLRHRLTGAEERFSVTARRDDTLLNSKGKTRAMGRFSTRINLRQMSDGWPLRTGVWDVHLAVSFEGVTQEVRLGRKRSAEVDVTGRAPVVFAPSATTPGHELAAAPFYTPEGDLSLEVSERLPLPGSN
ncbi:glycosyltransferase [Streptomyces sp. NPDC004267]|uniref:glycosyltransferase n=1 Tax=Streptomyces sp. NPDC004267 TaxID=3364694 RepID=UPI00369DA075